MALEATSTPDFTPRQRRIAFFASLLLMLLGGNFARWTFLLAFKPIAISGVVGVMGEYEAYRGRELLIHADDGAIYDALVSCNDLDAYLTEGGTYRFTYNPASLRIYGAQRMLNGVASESSEVSVECGDAATRTVFLLAYAFLAVAFLTISLTLLMNLLYGGRVF